MKLMPRLALCLTSTLAMGLTACAAKKQEVRVAIPVSPTRTTQPDKNAKAVRKSAQVRKPEVIRPYRVSRQEDPANPGILHDEHTVYRAETTPSWNMLPSDDANAPSDTKVGKSTEVTTSTEKLAAELEAKIEQQNQLLAATTEQNERLAAEIEKLQTLSTNRAPSIPTSMPPVPPLTPPPSIDPIPSPPSPAKPDPVPEPPAPPAPPGTNGPPRPWYQWWK